MVDGQLVPNELSGETLPGMWSDNFVLSASDESSIQGVLVDWDGSGVSVETSLDGETWELAARGESVMLVSPDTDVEDEELQIRVVFDPLVNSPYLNNLNVVGVTTSSVESQTGRDISWIGPVAMGREYLPIENHSLWGATIPSGSGVRISADPSDEPEPIRTVEMWVRIWGMPDVISIPGQTYLNGGVSAIIPGAWTLLHQVLNEDIDGELEILAVSGSFQLGSLVIYPEALTSEQVKGIALEYSNSTPLRVESSGSISITSSASSVTAYAHDWVIEESG